MSRGAAPSERPTSNGQGQPSLAQPENGILIPPRTSSSASAASRSPSPSRIPLPPNERDKAASTPLPSPTKTGTVSFISNLLTTPFSNIWNAGNGGGSSAKGKSRAAIPFGVHPAPVSPSPAPLSLPNEEGGMEALMDNAQLQLRPPRPSLPAEDSPARAVLSSEQQQDLTAGVADSFTFASPAEATTTDDALGGKMHENGAPRTPARSQSLLRTGVGGSGQAPRSASASNASSALASSAYATLSRVRTRASAASLRASLRNASGASSQGGNPAGGSSLISTPTSLAGGLFSGGPNSGGATTGSSGAASTGTMGRAFGASPAANWQEAIERARKLDAYVGKAVFQAGVDYESRPMVVLAGCGIPDPREVDHDALFDRIMSTMELFVETDYTLIYFASGGKHALRWSWIWKTYRRIGRKFRKNLKKLYIVHPTFFTKRFVEFISTGSYFVSPKFARKIVQVQTLSQLATFVPLTQIDIPPEVLQVNQSYEAAVTLPSRSGPDGTADQGDADISYDQQHQMFGVSLEKLMGLHGEKGGIPRVVRDCVEALRTPIPSPTSGEPVFPLDTEGLFRRSPASALLKTVQESYDRGHPVNLTLHYQDPHIPAALLKVFFRSLPVSLFPSSIYSTIRACPHPSTGASSGEDGGAETVHYIRNVLLASLEPPSAVPLLSYVFELLNDVARRSSSNRMDAANLATVWTPNLVSSGNIAKDMAMCKVEGLGQMGLVSPGPHAENTGSSPAAGENAATPAKQTAPGGKKAEMTLGTIVRICIERYHEIFDQVDAEIRPMYGSELSATLDALGEKTGEEGQILRRDSIIEHLDEAEVLSARSQYQSRRIQAGAGGRLMSVSESSVAESIGEEDEETAGEESADHTLPDGSPSKRSRSRLPLQTREDNAGDSEFRSTPWRRNLALASRALEESPTSLSKALHQSRDQQPYGLGLIPSGDTGNSTPSFSSSPVSPTKFNRPVGSPSEGLAKANGQESKFSRSRQPWNQFKGPAASPHGAAEATSPTSTSSFTTAATPASASTSLMMANTQLSSPSPRSQNASLPALSPSNRTSRSGKSITGIGGDGFRSPFGAASIGRNSSGSLRLTKDRLRTGSGGTSPAVLSPGVGGATAATSKGSQLDGNGSSPATDRSFLTGTASAVAVSGASVSGLFASPARSISNSTTVDRSLIEEDENQDENVSTEQPSHSSEEDPDKTAPALNASPVKQNAQSSSQMNGARKHSHRRGLSEVLEDLEQPAEGGEGEATT
ncbi:hypothetical protein OC845_002579 [Tilletia horrida]|nr:hypothetical protein OC845_002579 [Tilletia horrida]